MTRISYIALAISLTLALCSEDQVNACGGDDETCLMQTSVAYHKHHSNHVAVNEFEEMASISKVDQGAVQEVLHGLMKLPVLKSIKSEKALRETVKAKLHLPHLGKRHPQLLALMENPQKLAEIQSGLFQGHPSLMKILGHGRPLAPKKKMMPLKDALLEISKYQSKHHHSKQHAEHHHQSNQSKQFAKREKAEEGGVAVWMEQWGCKAEIHFAGFPYGEDYGMAPLYGEDCAGYPYILTMAVIPESKGVVLIEGNWSMETYKTTYTAKWVSEEGSMVLGEVEDFYSGDFSVDAGALLYISQKGDWPDYTYTLSAATMEGSHPVLNITDCMYPGDFKAVPGGTSAVWKCHKDWSDANSMNKVMMYSMGAEAPVVLSESTDYFGYMVVTAHDLYYTMSYPPVMYVCALFDCVPKKMGTLPQGAYTFMPLSSGEIVTSTYVSITEYRPSGTSYYTTYDILLMTGPNETKYLFETGGTDKMEILEPFLKSYSS